MFHLVARAVKGRLLFRNHRAAQALWRHVVDACPGLVALCLMPDHLHLQHPRDVRVSLGAALSGYARWRNARVGRSGPLFETLPEAEPLVDEQKIRRSIRYILLNPCRAGLVRDPLEWAWSTHRDSVGLTAWPACAPARDPSSFHAYVSSDPTVAVDGTLLPYGDARFGAGPPLDLVLEATSALTRTPVSLLVQRGPARSLLLRAARTLTEATTSEVAARIVLDPRTVRRAPSSSDALTRRIERVLGDRRFPLLDDRDLGLDPRWGKYRHRE